MAIDTSGNLQPLASIPVSDHDVEDSVRVQILAVQKGYKVLGDDGIGAQGPGADQTQALVVNALPSVIARKLTAMLPHGFVVAEFTLKFTVDGKIFGSGVGGEVEVKFAPKAPNGA